MGLVSLWLFVVDYRLGEAANVRRSRRQRTTKSLELTGNLFREAGSSPLSSSPARARVSPSCLSLSSSPPDARRRWVFGRLPSCLTRQGLGSGLARGGGGGVLRGGSVGLRILLPSALSSSSEWVAGRGSGR